jgi:hypothetical protein
MKTETKKPREIFKIKFDKGKTDEGVPKYMQYTIGATGLVDGELLTPQKITIRKERVIVEFAELGIQHNFAFTPDVELFYRDKVKEDAKETTD